MSTKTGRKSDEIAAHWRKFRRTHAVDSRNALVEHYMPLVDKLAEIIARRLWPRVSVDELASAGYDGLISAVGAFDPGRGVKFETFCRQRILGAIRDWQREIDPLGRSGRNFERSLNSAEEQFQAERGHAPTSVELARKMGLPLSKFIKMKKTVLASHCVPLESTNDRGEDPRIGSLVPADPSPGPRSWTNIFRTHCQRSPSPGAQEGTPSNDSTPTRKSRWMAKAKLWKSHSKNRGRSSRARKSVAPTGHIVSYST